MNLFAEIIFWIVGTIIFWLGMLFIFRTATRPKPEPKRKKRYPVYTARPVQPNRSKPSNEIETISGFPLSMNTQVNNYRIQRNGKIEDWQFMLIARRRA